MSFILAGLVALVALGLAYAFLLAGGPYAKSDAAQAVLFGLTVAACLAATHWLGW